MTEDEKDELEFSKTNLLSGHLDNKVRRMHPIYNVRYDLVAKAKKYFKSLDVGQ
jgi:hypothetical protein